MLSFVVDGCKIWTHLALDFGLRSWWWSHSLPFSQHLVKTQTNDNLVTILDGYFENGGQHRNLNVMDFNDAWFSDHVSEDVIVRISGYQKH